MCYVNINSLKPGKTDVGKLKEEVSVSGNEFWIRNLQEHNTSLEDSRDNSLVFLATEILK